MHLHEAICTEPLVARLLRTLRPQEWSALWRTQRNAVLEATISGCDDIVLEEQGAWDKLLDFHEDWDMHFEERMSWLQDFRAQCQQVSPGAGRWAAVDRPSPAPSSVNSFVFPTNGVWRVRSRGRKVPPGGGGSFRGMGSRA